MNQGMNHIVGGQIPGRLGNAHPNVVPYRDFQTADGYVLVACGNDGQFQNLCRMLDLSELGAEPRFLKNVGRLKDRDELEGRLAAAIRQWSSADLFAAMDRSGVPGGPVNRVDQILADPQIKARGLLHTMERQDGTPVTVIGYPSLLSRTPATYRLAPQTLGEDTASVLAQFGVDDAERARLRENGIIYTGD